MATANCMRACSWGFWQEELSTKLNRRLEIGGTKSGKIRFHNTIQVASNYKDQKGALVQ